MDTINRPERHPTTPRAAMVRRGTTSRELHGAQRAATALVLCVCLLSVVPVAGDSRARTGTLSDGDQFQVHGVLRTP
jgi:hypothetical protein